MKKNIFSYFSWSLGLFVIALPVGYWLGGWAGLWAVLLLSILETSLSLDNAIVNAKILQSWDEKWRRAFLVFGLPIAVFGMRLVFPILIVAFATGLGSVEVLRMATSHPDDYAEVLLSARHQIAAFGGAFLFMVFFRFFIDVEKKTHWIEMIEKRLTRWGKVEAVGAAFTLLLLFGFSHFLPTLIERYEFLMAGMWGVVIYIFSKGLGSFFGGKEEGNGMGQIVQQGVAGFLYLELLDASFSFDGVVGAFALSNNIFVIALGLGIGAMFVRSFTIYLVDKKAVESYRYLEHGAFWAIGALALIMFCGVFVEIPEVITGGAGALLIGAALGHSVWVNRRESRG